MRSKKPLLNPTGKVLQSANLSATVGVLLDNPELRKKLLAKESGKPQFHANNGFIFVRRQIGEETTEHGLVIPDSMRKEKEYEATVVYSGDERYPVGMTIVTGKHNGQDVIINGEKLAKLDTKDEKTEVFGYFQ